MKKNKENLDYAKNQIEWFRNQRRFYKARRDLFKGAESLMIEQAVCREMISHIDSIIWDLEELTLENIKQIAEKYRSMDERYVYQRNVCGQSKLVIQEQFYQELLRLTGRVTLSLNV